MTLTRTASLSAAALGDHTSVCGALGRSGHTCFQLRLRMVHRESVRADAVQVVHRRRDHRGGRAVCRSSRNQYYTGRHVFKKKKMSTPRCTSQLRFYPKKFFITGTPIDEDGALAGEIINYNERFWWANPWGQGRFGFGRFAQRINQEFRAAQFRGMPYPILWVAEYFTLDGEQIRWMRKFRQAGWYTQQFLW